MDDLINRQAAIDAIKELCLHYTPTKSVFHPHMDFVIEELTNLPSAQPERDIPVEPNEIIDRTWGIPQRQPICPRCDYYLGRIYFIGDGGSHVVYCEKCGQAINMNGWDFEKGGE